MAIHFPGLRNIDKPVVWAFPTIVVCLDCGTAKFALTEADCQLGKERGRWDRLSHRIEPYYRG